MGTSNLKKKYNRYKHICGNEELDKWIDKDVEERKEKE